MDIFRPSTSSRQVDYATSQKLRFDRQHLEEPRKNPGAYAYNPHLKMLCNDVDFLTKKAAPGDTAIYVGGSVGAYVLLLGKMFPTVNFVLYDHNLSNSVKKAKEEGYMPPNMKHREDVFCEKVATQLLLQDSADSKKLLLMSDLRNITRNAWGQDGTVAVTDDNVVNDLHLQENWVQLLRPRSAQLKFKLPYHGPATFNYLQGDVMVQLFGKQTTSEVRLMVDAPLDEMQEFPRCMYNKQDHEDSLYHHNFKTRTEHLDASNRIRISFDQHAAHAIFAQWKERAMQDADVSGIADAGQRSAWATARIQELDQAFDRALGLRMSEQLREDVLSSQAQVATTGTGFDPLFDKQKKLSTGRMWRKNLQTNKKGRIGTSGSAGAFLSKRKVVAAKKEEDEMEEGEI